MPWVVRLVNLSAALTSDAYIYCRPPSATTPARVFFESHARDHFARNRFFASAQMADLHSHHHRRFGAGLEPAAAQPLFNRSEPRGARTTGDGAGLRHPVYGGHGGHGDDG